MVQLVALGAACRQGWLSPWAATPSLEGHRKRGCSEGWGPHPLAGQVGSPVGGHVASSPSQCEAEGMMPHEEDVGLLEASTKAPL